MKAVRLWRTTQTTVQTQMRDCASLICTRSCAKIYVEARLVKHPASSGSCKKRFMILVQTFSWFFPIHDSSTNAWDQKIRNIEFLPYGPRYHHQGISQHRTPLGSASFWHFFLSKGMLWRQQLALQNLATCICPKRGLIKRFSYFII